MSINKFLTLLGLCTGALWVAWFMVLFRINPDEAGALAFIFFYASLGLSMIGTFSILGIIFRWKLLKEEVAYRQMQIATRQSMLFSFLLISALIFQSFRILSWWNILIMLFVFGGVETFFLSMKRVK